MMIPWKRTLLLVTLAAAVQPAFAQLRQYKPGFNLFSKEQDVALGKEAAGEMRTKSSTWPSGTGRTRRARRT
ncbi:MAG: hypothetical protein ACE141_16565 [Bryobacteraceae bacterium]